MKSSFVPHCLSFGGLVILLAIGILFTRVPALTHLMEDHPDELVFMTGACGVRDYFFHGAPFIRECKPYPEGAYMLQAPFQEIQNILFHDSPSARQIAGRFASVLFFFGGCFINLKLLRNGFDSSCRTGILYATIMIFGLFFIEQSRYGTGDSASFFLLSAAYYASAMFLKIKKSWLLYLSGCLVGILSAIKYTHILFLLLPLSTILIRQRNEFLSKRTTIFQTGELLLSALLGFLCFTPSIFEDPSCFLRIFSIEFNAYCTDGNIVEQSGVLNHVIVSCLFWCLYSEYPFAPIFMWKALRETKIPKTALHRYLTVEAPCALVLFLIFSNLTKTMFLRATYPILGILAVYTALGLSRIKHQWEKVGLCIGLVFLIGRGVLFSYVLAQNHSCDQTISAIADPEKWHETVFIAHPVFANTITKIPNNPGFLPPIVTDKLKKPISIPLFKLNPDARLEPGSLFISSSFDYSLCGIRFFPLDENNPNQILYSSWKTFATNNAEYYRGRFFPEWYYWMFGAWLGSCSTLTDYEFPSGCIFYNPAVQTL